MIAFLRVYLYWSVLWGFLVYPALGLKSLVPPLLLGIDMLTMGVCTLYGVAHFFDRVASPLSRQIQLASFACVFLIAYGLAVTASMGGSMVEAAMYLGALIRPMLILIAVAIHLRTSPSGRASTLYKILRIDLLLLVGAQLAIATLQKINPTLGSEFIPSLVETQSAAYALAEGDVSGTFANSIDLAYFLVAAFIVLTQRHWALHLAPPILLTCVFAFFVNATGSLAANICLWVYLGYLWLHSLSGTNRRLAMIFVALISVIWFYMNLSTVSLAVIEKLDDMMLSRLGLIFSSIPGLYANMPQRLLSGSGADFNAILTLLNNLPDVPLVFTYEAASSVINDVFWGALLLSIGAPAAFFFVYRMAQLFKVYIARSVGDKQTKNLVWVVWIIIFLAGMVNQILLVRTFTLVLTLGLLPLAMGSFHTRANSYASDNRLPKRI